VAHLMADRKQKDRRRVLGQGIFLKDIPCDLVPPNGHHLLIAHLATNSSVD
jgi:hypothetical protein